MSDIADARSVYLQARAEFEEWKEQFLAEWYRPDLVLATGLMVRGLPPELQQVLRQFAPDAMAYLDRELGGENGNI